MFARAYFLGNEIYTKNANFLLIDLAKLPINNNNVILILFISLFCPILTHCDPRKSSIFPIFVIFVIYRPRFCPFVHFVIVLYCIYAIFPIFCDQIL